jgi:hypothetical protein
MGAYTVPSPATAGAGFLMVAAFWNAQIRDPVNFLTNPALCVTRATVAQSIPTAAWTPLLFDANDKDTDSGHSLVTNTSRYTSATPGWYEIVGTVAYVTNATGTRGVRLWRNGTTAVQGRAQIVPAINVDTACVQVTGMLYLAVNEYVEIQTWQTSGGPLNTATLADLASYMHVKWNSK